MNGAAVLAHQGGWDEMLMVAGPLFVLAALLAVAHRRAHRPAAARSEPAASEPGGSEPG